MKSCHLKSPECHGAARQILHEGRDRSLCLHHRIILGYVTRESLLSRQYMRYRDYSCVRARLGKR